MLFGVLFLLAGSLVAAGLLASLSSRSKDRSLVDRAACLCLPGALLFVLILLAGCMGAMLFSHFSYVHLAPWIASWRGCDLYSGPDHGPIFNAIYPPLAAFVYAPCALARDPTQAARIAFAVNLVLFLTPVSCFLLASARNRDHSKVHLAWAYVFFVTAAICLKPTRYLLQLAHADAPAVAFGAMACFFAYCAARRENAPYVILASVFSVLAVWTKQVCIPIPVALTLFALATSGWRSAFRYVTWIALSGLVVSGLIFLRFGIGPMLFNIWTVPSRHPYQFSGMAWLGLLSQLANLAAPTLCLIVFFAYLDVRFNGAAAHSVRDWLRENRWTVLLFVSLCMLPVSILGRARVGGGDSSYHSVYYLVLAATVLLSQMAGTRKKQRKTSTVVLAMMLCSGLNVLFAVPTAREMERIRHAHTNSHQIAYQYALEHPRTAYFPQFPLTSLMAEGVPYHGEIGLLERRMAGFEPSRQHFRRHVPKDPAYVVFAPNTMDENLWILEYLPQHRCPTALIELPGWRVYRKCGSDRQ